MSSALEFGKDWKGMLQQLAKSELKVDVYLCMNAYEHAEDRTNMVAETNGVRIIYVGEDYFMVGPRRPVHSSIIPIGWVSMIKIHSEEVNDSSESLLDDISRKPTTEAGEETMTRPELLPEDA